MRTMEQWNKSKKDFSSFADPGDEIDEETFYYFLEVLPPARMTKYGFLVGEPYDHDNEGKPLYAAFHILSDGKYSYGGHKTVKEFSNGDIERKVS